MKEKEPNLTVGYRGDLVTITIGDDGVLAITAVEAMRLARQLAEMADAVCRESTGRGLL